MTATNYSPLWKRGAGGDFSGGDNLVSGEIPPNPPFSKGGTREPLRILMGLILLFVSAAFLAACSGDPKTGPVEIKWDRDGCTHCGMALSDRHFAAQVRGGPKKQAFKFDDIGCAVEWLQKQTWASDAGTEIWVMDYREGKWIDARKARYIGGKTSPMAYGYAALVNEAPNSIDFAELSRRVLAKENRQGLK